MKKLILLLSITIFCLQACEPSNTASKVNENTKTATTNNKSASTNNASKTSNKAPNVIQWEIDQPKMLSFIKENKIDAKWLKSGLYYAIEKQGTGAKPTINSTVSVSYTLSDLEGNQIWSTEKGGGNELRSLNKFPPGVAEGVQLIQAGGQIKLIVPSALAYGTEGWGKQIPPNTNLFYDIQLISVE